MYFVVVRTTNFMISSSYEKKKNYVRELQLWCNWSIILLFLKFTQFDENAHLDLNEQLSVDKNCCILTVVLKGSPHEPA